MRSVSRTNRLMMEPSDVSTVESSEPSTSCSLPTMVAATGIPGPTTSGTRSATAASKSWEQYLSRKHLGRHLTKSTAVYCVLVVGVWIFHGIPIVVFYSSAPQEPGEANVICSGLLCMSDNETHFNSSNNSTSMISCSQYFYLDNSTGLCRPECGEWNQYSQSTRAVIYGVSITFSSLVIVICVATLVLSGIRHKLMFKFPNIILVYISISRIVFNCIHLIGYIDEKALYCTSRDRAASFESGSPFCQTIGAATTYIPVHNLILLCFHLGMMLFGAYFPFHAREFTAKHRTKYVHITAVASAMIFPALTVGIQFAMGGYSRTMVPILCMTDTGSAFFIAIIPGCFLSAVFVTLVMILLFKVIKLGGCQCIAKKPLTGETNEVQSKIYTVAQIKLAMVFCASGFSNVLNYAAYSVVVRRQEAFSAQLDQYFDCESTGISPGKVCDRHIFESLDPNELTFPLAIITYALVPIATLIYVMNFERIRKLCTCK